MRRTSLPALLALLAFVLVLTVCTTATPVCVDDACSATHDPEMALGQLCAHVPDRFIECDMAACAGRWQDSRRRADVATVAVRCRVFDGIECAGPRAFERRVECVRHAGHVFPQAVLLSVLGGFLGLDRFYLGYPWLGVLKAVSLGGVGVAWLVDAIRVACGSLGPAEASFEPLY